MKMNNHKHICSSEDLSVNLMRVVVYLKVCLRSAYWCEIHLWAKMSCGSSLWSTVMSWCERRARLFDGGGDDVLVCS